MHVFADDAMSLGRGPGDVARHLRIMVRDALGAEAERGGIIVPGLQAAGIQQKVLLLEKMAQQVGREICGEDLLSVSVGHAIFKEGNADAEHLLCEADRQMYIIKKQHHSEPRYTREMLNFGAHAGRVN